MGRLVIIAGIYLLMTSCFSRDAFNVSCDQSCKETPPFLRDSGPDGSIAVIIAISGGGIRASAFSYGVLDELRLRHSQIFHSISHLSAVSGGAFTAAYLVSKPEDAFTEFEKFLYGEHELPLFWKVIADINILDPLASIRRRSALAAKYYDDTLFKGTTFGNLEKERPFLIINASDLVTGRRFTFSQEQFHCLGLDLSKFKIADAVAASSAFPVAFSTIVLKNRHVVPRDCFSDSEFLLMEDNWGIKSNFSTINPPQDATHSSALADLVHRIRYLDRTHTAYLHLSDGGLTDNLGLEAVKDILPHLEQMIRHGKIDGIVVISINSATPLSNKFGHTNTSPDFIDVVSTQSDFALKTMGMFSETSLQATLNDLQKNVRATGLPFFVSCLKFSFSEMTQESMRAMLSSVPTRLALQEGDIATLVNTGRFFVDANHLRLTELEKALKGFKHGGNMGNGSCSFDRLEQKIQ